MSSNDPPYDDISFKTIDQVTRFIANLWKQFPSIVLGKNPDNIDIGIRIFRPMINNSKEFCDNLSTDLNPFGFIKIGANIGKGGFGTINDIYIYENNYNKLILVTSVSLAPLNTITKSKFEPFYMNVVLKVSRKPSPLYINIFRKNLNNNEITFVEFNDPVTEAVFGGMASSIYDLGLTPMPSKYFGFYACKDIQSPDKYLYNTITEFNNTIFSNFFDRQYKFIDYITPDNVINFLIQFIYGMYVLKYYYGFVHFDTHLANLMVNFTRMNDLSIIFSKSDNMNEGPEPGDYYLLPEYYYHTKNLNDIEYFAYEFPKSAYTGMDDEDLPIMVITKNIGLLKLIDYGACMNKLNISKVYNYNAILLIHSLNNFDKGNEAIDNSIESNAFSYTTDIYFTLLNIYFTLEYGLDRLGNESTTNNQDILLFKLIPFLNEMFKDETRGISGIEDYIRKNNLGVSKGKVFKDKKGNFIHQDKYKWMFSNRSVGTKSSKFSQPESILTPILDYLSTRNRSIVNIDNGSSKNKGKVRYRVFWLEDDIIISDINPKNTLYLNMNYKVSYNNLNKYINIANKYSENCSGDYMHDDYCDLLDHVMNKHDPNNLMPKDLIGNTVEWSSDIWSITENNFKDMTMDNLNNFITYINPSNTLIVYYMTIYPAQIGMDDAIYKNYQLWFNYKYVNKAGYINLINIHIISLLEPDMFTITEGKNLWDAAKLTLNNYDNGISINANYFIVNKNLQNKFTGFLTSNDLHKPIGYYYNKNNTEGNGTVLPIPQGYWKYFGAIYIDEKLNIMRYSDFINMHSTIPVLEIYKTISPEKDLKFFQNVIVMNNGERIGEKPLQTDLKYDYAFVSGPILVENGKVIFTKDIMLDEIFKMGELDPDMAEIYKDVEYKVTSAAKSSKKFSANEDEKDFPYGQRHSNMYMNHNVLGVTNSGELLFFLIEGRGFDAPGLTRELLAEIVLKFDINTAISLDGGFSANAVLKTNKNDYQWILNDPEKRKLGLVMSFGYN